MSSTRQLAWLNKSVLCIQSWTWWWILLAASAVGLSQTWIIQNANEIDDLVQQEMKSWHVPGCALAITSGSKLIYAQGYGYRQVEDHLITTPHTVFKIASCTKSFTAAAAGLLVYQNRLAWDKPLREYLPHLKFGSDALSTQVSIRDCLAHRTGVYDDDWSWVGDHVDEKRLFEIIEAMPVHQPLRTGFIYSNMMYALAGHLTSHLSKEPWRELIRKYFFKPLGMDNSGFSHRENSGLNDFAYGYEFDESSGQFRRGDLNEHFTDSLSVCEPFGFISSSALDLAQWIRLFINGGNYQGQTIIPQDIYTELIKPITYIAPGEKSGLSESYYAMGWIQNYYQGHRLLQHSGGLTGFKSYMSFMPEDSLGIVVLTNGPAYLFPKTISYDLYDLLLHLPKSNWSQRQKIIPSEDQPEAAKNYVDTKPCKPLNAYAGIYTSPWLGRMTVLYQQDELYFQFHLYPPEKMHHAHYETFYTEHQRKPGQGITFIFDHDGDISGLMLNEFKFDRK